MWNHWAIRADSPEEPFQDFENSRWAWDLLRGYFPNALAAVLMPNHVHLILDRKTEARDRLRLSCFKGAMSKRLRNRRLWQRTSEPSLVPDRHHLRRQIRYVALNPCRKRLCADPTEWIWSTYRDLIGASAHPWVDRAAVVRTLGERESGFAVRFHEYVSGDPSVAVGGTRLPTLSTKQMNPSLEDILESSAAALRVPTSEVTQRGELRTLFLHMALLHGWSRPALLSTMCGITTRAIQNVSKQHPPRGVDAALLCLSDARLRRGL
jgi:hypothetical protein